MRWGEGGPGSSGLDELVLLDRSLDLVTPMCTQLTYEGLMDETLHIRNGAVQLESAGTHSLETVCSFRPVSLDLFECSCISSCPILGTACVTSNSEVQEMYQPACPQTYSDQPTLKSL